MQSLLEKNRFRKKTPALLLCLALLFANVPLTWSLPAAIPEGLITETPVLIVSGDELIPEARYTMENISREKSYTLAELKALTTLYQENLYSTINSSAGKRIYRGQGVSLSGLLSLSGYALEADSPLAVLSGAFKPEGSAQNLPGFYFPNHATNSEIGKTPVEPILAWASAYLDAPSVPQTADLSALAAPTLMVGQRTINDVNNGFFVRDLDTLRLGNELTVPLLSVGTSNYTRAQILRLPRAVGAYGYTGGGNPVNDTVRGVPIAELLPDYPDDYIVDFHAADNYAVPASGKTKAQLVAANALLAYEIFDAGAWKGVYSEAKSNPEIKGYFTLYLDGATPGKMIDRITAQAPLKNNPYKHITNGGAGGSAPYNIDAITGATLTVEGPGVMGSVPITVRELEETGDANIHRGLYTDLRGGFATERIYEGVKVLSILDGLVNSNVSPLDDQVEVVFKNRWRQEVGRLSYTNIKNAATPVILAYGTAFANGGNAAPFVFNLAAGTTPGLGNDDGPLKLVYDQGLSPGKQFGSVAYMYIEEGLPPPGFKHITATNTAYNNPANTEFILTFTGDELGREVNYTVRELEEMANDNPALCHRDEYSLSNTTYWYVNEYEGIDLWKLLLEMGVNASSADDNNTLVSFSAWDNYQISTQFSFYQLAHPEAFYFYEKSPLDIGANRPTKAQLSDDPGNIGPELGRNPFHPDNRIGTWTQDGNGYPVKAGYPVLLAYGVNSYPYVRNDGMEGYKSGLANSGGPMRLIYGKTDGLNRANAEAEENYAYFFNNGSQQLQRLQEIYVGNGIRYSTHLENPGPAYQALKDQQALTVEIVTDDGIQTRAFTLAELESILYDSSVSKSDRDSEGRQEKGYYYYPDAGGALIQDLFEGVNLEYLLTEVVGLQGNLGTVELYSNETLAARYNLPDIGAKGYNSLRDTEGLGMTVAFAKNGYPLVAGNNDSGNMNPGYLHNDPVSGKTVRNGQGPLLFVRGQNNAEFASQSIETGLENKTYVDNLSKIVINLEPDPYAHIGAGYEELAAQQIKFSGAVIKSDGVSLTVRALETKQRYIVDGEYTVGGSSEFYRGLDLYRLLYDKEIGAGTLLEEITVINSSGGSTTLSYEELTAGGKKVILAYGSGAGDSAKPLGLAEGGPMRLIIEGGATAKWITNVSEIIISSATINAWKHSFGVYSQYANQTLEISGQNLVHNKTYTVAGLEAMDNIIVQDSYKIGANTAVVQGVELYKLLQNIGFAEGLDSSVFAVYASDGYSPGSFTASQLKDGINGKPILVAFGQGTTTANGLPLASGEAVKGTAGPGYNPNVGNDGGPLRLMIHDNSGWSVKFLTKIVVGQAGGNPDPDLKHGFHIYPGGTDNMPNASIRTVVSDDTGGIWAGSNGAGAAYITPAGTITKYAAPQLKTDFVTGIALGPDGSVWLAQGGSVGSQTAPPTNHYGFARYQNNIFTFYSSSNLPNDCVYGIDVDKEGNVWLATQHTLLNGGMAGGLTKFAPAANQWQSWKMADGLPTVSAWAVKSDGMGGAWVTTYRTSNITLPWPDQSYAHISAEGAVTAYPIPAGNDYTWSRSIAIDPAGGAYITRMSGAHDPANDGGWLDYISPGGSVKSYKGDGLIPDLKAKGKPGFYPEIRTVFVDDSGDLWLATNGLGVYRCAVNGDDISIIENYSSAKGNWPAGAFDDVWSIHISKDGKAYFGSNGGVAWAEVIHTITASAGAGGSISPAGKVKVRKGTDQTFSITAEKGYLIKDVLVDGEIIGAESSYTFFNINADGHTIEAIFEQDDDGGGGGGNGRTHVGDATSSTAILKVSGGVPLPGYFSMAGLRSYSAPYAKFSKAYSSRNNAGTDGSTNFDGVNIEDFLKQVMKINTGAKSITVESIPNSLGQRYKASFNLNDNGDEWGIYWTSSVDGNKMMLAWKEDGIDLSRPRLVVPQRNITDINKPNWIYDIESITVNEEVVQSSGNTGNWRPPTEEQQLINKIIETVDIKATVSSGKATATVKTSDITSSLSKINNQLEPGGQAQLILNITGTENLAATDIIITAEALKALAEQNALSVSGKCALGEVTLAGLLITQANKAGKDLIITFENQDTATLATQAKKALNVKFTQGGQPLTQLDNLVIISIPYKWSAEDGSREQLVAGYLTESGTLVPIPLCSYDEARQCLNLAAPQPGLFLVQQKKFSFSDSVAWAEDAINFLAAHGIVQGRGNDLFLPNATVTRAEFLRMLLGTLPWTEALTDAPETGFKDVAKGAWYENYVKWAVAKGVVSGYEDGTFRPNDPISREEIAVMVKNFLPAAGIMLPKVKIAPAFSDNDKINSWSLSAVQELGQYGLLTGFPDGSFKPQKTCTRAEAATIVAAYIKAYLAE